jgi:phosphopantetheinyl transferase
MPIFWTFEKIDLVMEKCRYSELSGLLGQRENTLYQKFKVPKRKTEWLGARLAIKYLLKAVDNSCQDRGFSEIEILNKENGSPFLSVSGEEATGSRISLSHSNGYVFCAYSPVQVDLGVDLELIEERPAEFIADFFTTKEMDQVRALEESQRNLAVNLIWSGKESVLKALSTGLRVDTRSITVIFPVHFRENDAWNTLAVNSPLIHNSSLGLYCRREGNFILTVCAPSMASHNLVQVKL